MYRDFNQARADERRQALLDSLDDAEIDTGYSSLEPNLRLGLPFKQMTVSDDWFDWPALPDLFPVSFPGVKTSRDGFLVDIDLDRLRLRVYDYFDVDLSHEEITRRYPGVMKKTARFDARKVRAALLARGGPDESGFVRFAYRPFDTRWLYWEKDTKLLDEKRADYRTHVFEGNVWIGSSKREIQADFTHGTCVRDLANWKYGFWGVHLFPAWLRGDGFGNKGAEGSRRQNLSGKAQRYLDRLGLGVEDLFHHVLATLHDPDYRAANAAALRVEWPRITLPGWGDSETEGAAEMLATSAARGRELAVLLDPDTPVPGITQPPLRPTIATIGVPATTDGRNMRGDDFAITAGWGHFGSGHVVMPGPGRTVERAYTASETLALGDATLMLGETTFDIHLNGGACWRNVPAAVWLYKLGGYQVLKKWLSYRERDVLGRVLTSEDVQHFTDTARRIGAILLGIVR